MAAPEHQDAIVEVAAALIRDETGRYLITRRVAGSHLAGLWEFPGGKREPGETLEACLRRELVEELGADFTVGEKVETVRWRYPDKTVVLHFYRCRLCGGQIEPREQQVCAWVEPAHLAEYDFPPADRALIERLRA
jgi:mutator protein MutT